MSIFTGHTSLHDPHRLLANGSDLCRAGSRAGLMIEPIGPATVTP
jgi:hypothetical protein